MKKKHWIQYASVTAALAATSVAQVGFADMTGNNSPVSQQINTSGMSADQKAVLVGSRVDQITTKNVNGTLGGKLPNYLYNEGFAIGIDYLFWRTDVDSMPYAIRVFADFDSRAQVNYKTKQLQNDFGFDSGFRLGLGYTFANQDQWDLYLNWTYFHNSEGTSASVPGFPSTFVGFNSPYLISSWSNFYLGDFLTSASDRWRLNYNTIDIELGRNFFVGKQLSVRPHWGLRGAWLNQDQNVNYTGFWVTPGFAAFLPGTSSVRNDLDWHGVALRTGADMRWSFDKNWAVFAKASASLFYGRFVIREHFLGNRVLSGALVTTNKFETSGYNAIRPEVEACLGLEWACFFHHDDYRFALSAAWEVQEWFEQNMMYRAHYTGTELSLSRPEDYPDLSGNLGIQGLTVKARFDF